MNPNPSPTPSPRRSPAGLPRRAAVRAGRIVSFVGYFAVRFVESNVMIAWEILTPGSRLAPAIIELPLRCRTAAEISTYVNLITLTPGTLTLEIDHDAPVIYVHGTHAADPEAFLGQLRELEDKMLAAWRPVREGGPDAAA